MLHGFQLVDPSDHSVRTRDLCLDHGAVCSAQRAAQSATFPHIQGQGRFLLPALWDLRASLWGNDSARNYEELYQEMSIGQSLRVQLYYGVAHVGTYGMSKEWVLREMKRAHALEYPAAELIYPDKALCGGAGFACDPVHQASELPALLEERKSHGTPYVQLSYCEPKAKHTPGLSKELLAEALRQAAQRGLKAFVLVEDWQHAREAAELGAALVSGLPEAPVPADVLQVLKQKQVAFTPALAGLELDRVLGSRAVLADPFLTVTTSVPVLATFQHRDALWSQWLPELEAGQRGRDVTLANLRRLVEGGVRVIQVSDAGWATGTFQGYSSHAAQVWLERAGLDPWARLSAATLWPAELVGRTASFAPGAPADFIALDADPLASAANLRRLAFVIREGKVVDRASLEPDLTRQRWQP